MDIGIKVGDFHLTYEGPHTAAGLYDLVTLARHIVEDVDEPWVFGDPTEVLIEHFGLSVNQYIKLSEDGAYELVPTPEYQKELQALRDSLGIAE